MMTPFPVCPPHIPPRIGRDRIFRQLIGSLTKPTPQSLSLVGPRYSGKSVLLKALEENEELKRHYCCIVYWDLGHNVPRTDEEFVKQMARHLGRALADKKPDLSEYLLFDDSGYDQLVEVLQTLEQEGMRVLMLWDGMDRAMGTGDLTRNLWDNLLSLGRLESLWLVTASRQKLQSLIRDAASVTSEFWLLFEPHTLMPMEEADIEAFIASSAASKAVPGAAKEILNWTGGIPPLVASLLNLATPNCAGTLTPAGIQEAAHSIDERTTGLLEAIWNDCGAPTADLFRSLCEAGSQPFSTLPKRERRILVDSGLAKHEKNQLAATCRWLQEQVLGPSPEIGAISRMFGTPEVYEKNIRGILERRLSQIDRFDERLFHLVENSLRELPGHPDLCLANLSHIEDQAFEIIWAQEVGQEKIVPQAWITEWKARPDELPKPIRDMMVRDEWEIKNDRGPQLAILQLITGSHHAFTNCQAQSASKDSYVLLNAIHSFRNRSQHASGQSINLGVAVSALLLCIELIAMLAPADQ